MVTWRPLPLGVLCMLLPLTAAAQMGTGRVTGSIRNERGQPIKGATVTAANDVFFPRTLTSATDAKGRFSILGLRSTIYRFTIRADGFEEVTVTLPMRASQPNPPLDLRLMPKLGPAPPPLLANVDTARLQHQLDAAAALASNGQIGNAIAAYKAILKDTPSLTSVNVQLGRLFELTGERAAALAAYEAALKGDPDSTTARDAIARLRAP